MAAGHVARHCNASFNRQRSEAGEKGAVEKIVHVRESRGKNPESRKRRGREEEEENGRNQDSRERGGDGFRCPMKPLSIREISRVSSIMASVLANGWVFNSRQTSR